jgi:hypothetical protein
MAVQIIKMYLKVGLSTLSLLVEHFFMGSQFFPSWDFFWIFSKYIIIIYHEERSSEAAIGGEESAVPSLACLWT